MNWLKAKINYIIGTLFFLFLWLPIVYWSALTTLLWVAPPENELTVLKGQILRHDLVDCDTSYCDHPPYELKMDNGKVIDLYCELPGNINICFYTNEYKGFIHKDNLTSESFANKYITIKAYNHDPDGLGHFVIMSAQLNGKTLISYNESVKRIRNSELYIFQEGAKKNRAGRGPGHTLFWFLWLPLTLYFGFVLVSGFISKVELEGKS